VSKIQSQAGNSLADMYDVRGSIAGIDELFTQELPIVHEMGATVFSERLSSRITRVTTGAILQNADWSVEIIGMVSGGVLGRLVGVSVFTTAVARVLNASLSLQDSLGNEREIPIFAWDAAGSGAGSIVVQLRDEGAAIADFDVLIPSPTGAVLPVVLTGALQPRPLDTIVFRGLTAGFGAGTVATVCLAHMLFPFQSGLSSRGLPVPSW